MLSYTHVTRVGLGKGSDGKQQYKTLLTPSCSIPVTIEDVRGMIIDPKFTAMVDVTINENGGDEYKRKVKMPLICKLLCNSLGLGFNAAARQNDGVDPLKLASEVLAGDDADAKADALAAMAGGKATLKAWAEAYADSMDAA